MGIQKDRLRTEHLSMRFDDRQIIEDISIKADEGELVSLLGISGSGKTTLFNCISGIYEPTEGKIFLDGEDVTGSTGKISYMLQKDLLLPHKTMEDNVALPLIIRGMDKRSAHIEAVKHFSLFGLEGTEQYYPMQLSGGMRQRAALLRTYLFSDKVALLDEPFAALDTITKSTIHRWYLQIMKDINLTTLFITHDINEAVLLSDRIYVMGSTPGRIVGEVTVAFSRDRRENFELTEDFLEYKRQLIALMKNNE